MARNSILASLMMGLVAGWLASVIVGGNGLLRYIIIGVLGSYVGSFVLSSLRVSIGIANPILRDICVATLGAVVLVVAARIIA